MTKPMARTLMTVLALMVVAVPASAQSKNRCNPDNRDKFAACANPDSVRTTVDSVVFREPTWLDPGWEWTAYRSGEAVDAGTGDTYQLTALVYLGKWVYCDGACEGVYADLPRW